MIAGCAHMNTDREGWICGRRRHTGRLPGCELNRSTRRTSRYGEGRSVGEAVRLCSSRIDEMNRRGVWRPTFSHNPSCHRAVLDPRNHSAEVSQPRRPSALPPRGENLHPRSLRTYDRGISDAPAGRARRKPDGVFTRRHPAGTQPPDRRNPAANRAPEVDSARDVQKHHFGELSVRAKSASLRTTAPRMAAPLPQVFFGPAGGRAGTGWSPH